MKSSFARSVYSILLFLLFLISMECWIGWGQRSLSFTVISFLLIITKIFGNIGLDVSRRNVISVFIIFIGYLWAQLGWRGNISPVVLTQITTFFLPAFFILCACSDLKQETMAKITKWFAWLMIPSIVLYVVTNNVHLPSLGIISFRLEEDVHMADYGICYNYFFYLKPIGESYRFRGPFLEPGHLGMMCFFLLFTNKYDFKNKYNVIILIALLLSFSLAGFMLGIIGFFFTRYYEGQLKLKNLVLYTLLIIAFVGIGQTYNDGENQINDLILSRLESDEERGFAGNNRSSLFVAELYNNIYNDPKTLLLGYDKETQEMLDTKLHGTGFKLFMVRKGLLSVFFAFAFYFYQMRKSQERKYAFLYFFLFVLCFWQRCYFFWFSWIICYAYGINNRELEKQNI